MKLMNLIKHFQKMKENVFVIHYPNKVGVSGGLGDRIIGLISIKLISKLLNRKFYILWEKENIKQYINYKKYDFSLVNIKNIKFHKYMERNIKFHKYIDNQKGLKKYLMTSTNIFPKKINYFQLNQEISQYLYKNELFKEQDYIKDILNEYKTLYTNILIPTNYLMGKINKLTSDKKNIVGIQIRCGDHYMNEKEGHPNPNKLKSINSKLLNIKIICETKFNNDYNIFFTTDNLNVLEDINSVFGKSKIIYNNDKIQHIDRKAVDKDTSKVFVDNYILSQKTDLLIISEHSNYGRIAALSCNHNNIYNYDNLNILNKKILLSKGEKLFS